MRSTKRRYRFQYFGWWWNGASIPVIRTISGSRETTKCLIVSQAMCEADRTIERCWRRIQKMGAMLPINFKREAKVLS